MKGTFFQKPLELNLRVDGESWRQGQPVAGELTVRNHGAEAISTAGIRVALAHGDLKKVRAKSSEAFKALAEAVFSGPATVAPGQQASFTWNFPTDANCPITDTLASPFVIYGSAQETEKLGQLQLAFKPSEVIEEFENLFRTRFRFVPKSQKWSKGWVDLKLVPPDARGFVTLDYLIVSFQFDGDALKIAYDFRLKKVEATVASTEVKKEKKELDQSLSVADYRRPSGRLDDERIEAAIREAVEQVENKILL